MRPEQITLPLRFLARIVRREDGTPGIRSLSLGGRATRRGKAVAHRPDDSPFTRPSLATRKASRRRANEIAHESRRRNA